jgi:hypothetical protein
VLRIWYLLLLYRQLSQRLEMAATKMSSKGAEVAQIIPSRRSIFKKKLI